ncbi:TPA: hypothetical protein U7D35_002073 [Streptococcus agalactiae]|nr:hypothetical protein [Streptococcus agalactiae]HEN7902917.1 hypothetical protein [Streptococcus agalactiae]
MNKIEAIIDSIQQSKITENDFGMLTSSLTLIDICSSIEFLKTNKDPNERYKQWIEKYLIFNNENSMNKYLDSTNIWHLRCSLLHESSANPNTQYSYKKYANHKVKDIVPTSNLEQCTKGTILNVESNGEQTLFFDLKYFVDVVVNSTIQWMEGKQSIIKEVEPKLFSIAHVIDNDDGKITIIRKLE